MPNTHAIADMAYELQATCEDLLPACVISTTFPTVPASSLTLAAFATQGYVRDGQALVYVDQPAITLTLTGSDGTYWLAISRDVSTAYASWTRRAGSHYLWRLAGTRPPDVDGLLVFASCTVAGGVVTATAPAPGVTRAEAWRALSGLGTMAEQNANAVAITGGQIVGLSALNVQGAVGINVAAGGYALHVDATVGGVRLIGPVGLGTLPDAVYLLKSGAGTIQMDGRLTMGAGSLFSVNNRLALRYPKDTEDCLVLVPTGSDACGGSAILFRNVAGTIIGSISTNASATAYNTSSDVRLKHAVATLAGALERVQALRPVAFRWNADDSPGVGFLAHELQTQIPEAVTGEPDAVHDDGSIRPQQVDQSRLVPWLTAALQETLAQLDAAVARITTLEEALGL